MNYKKLFSVFVMLLVTIVTIAGASAKQLNSDPLAVDLLKLEVNGDELSDADDVIDDVTKGDELDVKLKLMVPSDEVDPENEENPLVLKDVVVEAGIYGYDKEDQMYDVDYESLGDMTAGHPEKVTLNLKLPSRMEAGEYALKITLHDRLSYVTFMYVLNVVVDDYAVAVKDVVLSPSVVEAGRSTLVSVLVENTGNRDQDVVVRIAAPQIAGAEAVDYLDDLEAGEKASTEDLYLTVPRDTAEGVYEVVVAVEYKDGDKQVTVAKQLTVKNDVPKAEDKTILAVATAAQDVVQGEGGAIYPLAINNAGTESKTYVVTVDGYQDWAKLSVNPSSVVVVEPGQAQAVYVYVSALETAAPGEHMFSLTVKSGDQVLKQLPVKANVVAKAAQPAQDSTNSWSSAKKGLEIGLIVLIVLLVILGLIIGFSKLKGNNDDLDDEEDDKTYY